MASHLFRASSARRFQRWLLVWLNIVVLLAGQNIALANPLNGTVVAGSATIHNHGDVLHIHQETGRAIINWQGFSIGPGETTQFIQPNSNAATLNRVTGAQASALMGTLQANGNVFLLNPNGILIGGGATINVGGFVASTLDVNNAQFMRGGDLTFSGNSSASVVNRGNVTALEGNIFLIGAHVENHGSLNAANGTVGLAAGQEVRLVDSAHQHLVVQANSRSLGGTGVVNTGLINAVRAELLANGGNVYALAINNQGTVRATGVANVGGRVLLTAPGGKIANSGDLIAKNGDQTGGTVHVLGDDVRLTGGTVDVSGANGGGVALIGGDYQGSNPNIANAQAVYVDSGVTINADATLLGDGGKVIVWSDDTTSFAGNITARGGLLGGNGGFAEVSGKQTLNYTGLANLSAPAGQTGTLLLDPTNFPLGVLEAAAIVGSLAGANVTVATAAAGAQDGDVTIGAPILYDSANGFAILAHGDIVANASVQNNGTGAVSLVAGWDGVTEAPGGSGINSPATFDINNIFADPNSFGNAKLNGGFGSVFIGSRTQTSGIAVGSRFGPTNVAAFDLNMRGGNINSSAFAQLGFRADSSMANFNINGTIDVALINNLNATGGSQTEAYVQVGHGGLDFNLGVEPDGNYAGDITIRQANDLNFSADDNFSANFAYAQLGHGGVRASGNHSGLITITQAKDLNFSGGGSQDAYAQLGHGGHTTRGNHSGAITITQAKDLNFSGGGFRGRGLRAYAQLGHGGLRASGNHSGAITITGAKDLNFSGGGSEDAYAQLGHGGFEAAGDQSGKITITQANDLNFSGGRGFRAHAQLGHGGRFASGNHIGDITIIQANNLNFSGGGISTFSRSNDTYAQLGHGGTEANGNHSGAITITLANDLNFSGGGNSNFSGSGNDAYAQLGHGGYKAAGDHSGDLTITQANNLNFSGGIGSSAYAQLGHGGRESTGNHSGAITIIQANDLNFSAGGNFAYAQLGHGGFRPNGGLLPNGNHSGKITITQANNLNFSGGGIAAYAQLGHRGIRGNGNLSGAITVIQANDLNFSGGGSSSAYAQLGHGGSLATGNHSGAITIIQANDLNFSAGGGGIAYAQLGHGGLQANGNHSGAITITQANDLNFSGGGISAYAQLGHGGLQANGNHSGAITITLANDLNFSGGGKGSATAQLGHGGIRANASGNSSGTRMGNIDIRVAGETSLVRAGSHWLIGHATSDANAISNANVTLITGTLDYFTAGTSLLSTLNEDFAIKMVRNLAGGDVTIGSTNLTMGPTGGMSINGAFLYDSPNNLSFLSATDIRFNASRNFNASVQNNSMGQINVVAGWDGTTGVASPLVIGAIFGDVTSFGTNNGSVFIGNGMQTSGIAVGSRFGPTNVAAFNLNVRGSDTTVDAFAQLGFRADSSMANFNINGTIDVALQNDLTATAGRAQRAYVQVGHGGTGFGGPAPDGNFQGAITILQANDLNFTAGANFHSGYAQLGHGGDSVIGNHSGPITITQARDLKFTGGGNSAYAQLGHGGTNTNGNESGAITITEARDLVFSSINALAQLGHGGTNAIGNKSGAITITKARDLNFTADGFYSQLGHGGLIAVGNSSGAITISEARDLNFTADGFYSQLGHGGQAADGNHSGSITITQARDLNFSGGGNDAYAQLGHGGLLVDGNHSGAITITQAHDLTFTGGGNSAYAQLGHGGLRAGSTMAIANSNIVVNAAGNLMFTAGGGKNAYAQLGHGGFLLSKSNAGVDQIDISVSAVGISFTGNGTAAYAQLGHGGATLGAATRGNLSGTITIDATGNLTFMGGSSLNAYTQLGHGGVGADGNHSGAIILTKANDLSFSGGGANNAYAQLGHGGVNTNGNHSGAITVDATGNLTFDSGNNSYAQLGHGGDSAAGNHSGAITITEARDLNFVAAAQLGHGGRFASGNHSGNITITKARDLNFGAAAKLGHGGSFAAGNHSGAITITAARDLNFAAAAQLGHGGRAAAGNHSGAITITQARDLNFAAAQLGHGGIAAAGNHSGAITITQARDLNFAAAQLGHGGENVNGTLSGDISVRLVGSNLFLTGGSGPNAYAQLGHGAASGNTTGIRTGNINVIIDGSAFLAGNSALSPALLGHATNTPGGIAGNLVLAIDQINPVADNGGRLFMNEFSAIDSGGAPNEVRIFGTRRLGNMLADGAVINGITVDSSLPPGTLVGNRWNPNSEFVNWDHEQWGPTSNQSTLASPGPFTAPFTFFYLDRAPTPPTMVPPTMIPPTMVPPLVVPYDRFGRAVDYYRTLFHMFPNGPYAMYFDPEEERPMGELSGNSSNGTFGGL